VFYCAASVTIINTNPNTNTTGVGTPDVHTEDHRVKVTMLAGDKARWQVVS
jgi:hypothetical protein